MQSTFWVMEDQNRRQKITMLDGILEIIDFLTREKLLLKMYKGKIDRFPNIHSNTSVFKK